MITSYVPRPARWLPAVILVPIAALWGGFAIIGYVERPKWTSPGGTAAEHVRRGNEIMKGDDYPDEQGVCVAALEYEAALLREPTNEDAALGKAACLEALVTDWQRQPASAYHRQALALSEGVLKTTRDATQRLEAQEQAARLHGLLGEDLPALEGYRRLLGMGLDADHRERVEYAAAGHLERLGRFEEALAAFRKVEIGSGHLGLYMEDVQRLQKRLAGRPLERKLKP